LIGEQKWEQLHVENKDLEELVYLVVCETCGEKFFTASLAEVKKLLLSGEWDPYLPNLWYVQAARHWVAQKFHSIRVYVIHGADKTLLKDLTSEWKAQILEQKKMLKKGISIDKAMLNELDDLEKEIKKRIKR
jgi:hypothetical protein